MMRKLIGLLFVVLLAGCFNRHPWVDGATEATLEVNAFPNDSIPERYRPVLTIANLQKVQQLCGEINNAEETTERMGAQSRNILTFWKGDAMWSFVTNGKVFHEEGNQEQRYQFKSDKILIEYFSIDTIGRN